MQLIVGALVTAIHFIIAYFLWRKKRIDWLAGYVEGQTPSSDKIAKYAGIFMIVLGLVFLLIPLLPNHFYIGFIAYFAIIIIGVIAINIAIHKSS